MEIPRPEVQAYLQASLAFAEFCRQNELTATEREALGNLAQSLGLDVHRVPLSESSTSRSINDS
jgi:hypothetical protein